MKKLKSFGHMVCFILLLLSVSNVFQSGKRLLTLPSASDYTDEGVHTFVPKSTYPTQKETRHHGRHTTKRVTTQTVHKIVYAAIDGSGYQWIADTFVSSEANNIVKEKKPVERRVLFLHDGKTHFVIDGKETIDSYIQGMRKKDMQIFSLAGVYILIYGAIRFFFYQRRKWAEETE